MAAVTSALSPQTTLVFFLSSTVFMMLFIVAYTAFVLGLFLLNPVFSEKSAKLGLNIVVAVAVSIGLFAISLFSLMRVGVWSVAIEGIFSLQMAQTVLSWLVSIMFLCARDMLHLSVLYVTKRSYLTSTPRELRR